MALDPKPVPQHNHAIADIPIGRGDGKLPLYAPGTNVTFTNDPSNAQRLLINAPGVAPGGGVIRQFTWVSGATSVPAEGLYGTFAAAQAAAAAAAVASRGVVTLYAAGVGVSNIATIETVAAYDMTNIELVGVSVFNRAEPPQIRVPNGVTFSNLARVRDMTINYLGGGVLMTQATGTVGVDLYWGPNFQISPFGGGLPGTILQITGAGTVTMYLGDNSALQGGDAAGVVADIVTTATLSIQAYSDTNIGDEIFSGPVGSAVLVTRQGSSIVGRTQSLMLGTYAVLVGNLPYEAGNASQWQYISSPPPETLNDSTDLLVGSKFLFGAAFDPQNVFTVSQGAVQAVLSPPNTLVASGLLAGANIVSPGVLVGSNTPVISCGVQTLAALDSDAYVNMTVSPTVFDLDPRSGTRYSDVFTIGPALTSSRLFTGLIADTGTLALQADNPTAAHVGLQFSSSRGDVNFQVSYGNGITQTLVSTGIAANTNFFRFDLIYLSTGEIYVAVWRMVPGFGSTPAFRAVLPIGSGPASASLFAGIRSLSAAARRVQHSRITLEQRMNSFNPN